MAHYAGAWLKCPTCEVCGSSATRFARVPNSTGWQVRGWCSACGGHPVQGRTWWPKSGFAPEQLAALEAVPQSPQLPLLPMEQRCPVCLAEDVVLEKHHLAPRARFGREADRWPTHYVCRRCHERWHARMGCPIHHDNDGASR